MERGHKDAARIEIEKARAADPRAAKNPELSRRLGELHLEAGKANAARPLLETALEAEPNNPNLLASVGRARRLQGDLEGAREALGAAIAINPFIPQLHCDLAALATSDSEQQREQDLCPSPPETQ